MHRFHKFSLDVSSLIATTSAFVKTERSNMGHLKKFVKPMEVKIRSKMIDLRFHTGMNISIHRIILGVFNYSLLPGPKSVWSDSN